MKKLEELSKEELLAMHRRMWHWLASYYENYELPMVKLIAAKQMYLSAVYPEYVCELMRFHSGCFACYYACQQKKKLDSGCHHCNFCFFDCNGGCINGIFARLMILISSEKCITGDKEVRTDISKLCRQIAEAKTKEERQKEFLTTDILFPDGEYTVNLTERSIRKRVDDVLKQPSFTITIDNTDLFEKLGKIGCGIKDTVRVKNGNIYRYPLDDMERVIFYVPDKETAKKMLNAQYGTGVFHVRDQFQCCCVPIRSLTGPFNNC